MKKKQYICPQTECIETNLQDACLLAESGIPIDPNPTDATEPEEVKAYSGASSHGAWEIDW